MRIIKVAAFSLVCVSAVMLDMPTLKIVLGLMEIAVFGLLFLDFYRKHKPNSFHHKTK